MNGFGSDKIRTWVFVTGLPRSGTTFVGKVLSLPWAVDYLHEPFNPGCGIPGLNERYVYLRPDLEGPQERLYHDAVSSLLRYEVRFKTGLYNRDSELKQAVKRIVGSRGGFYLRLAKWNPFHEAAVIKDPTGFLMSEFMAHHFAVKPVVVIRHPVSLAASWLRLGWQPALPRLVKQPALIEDYLADEVALLTQDWTDPVARIAVFWRAAHKVLLQQAARHPGWSVVTHEALSAEPMAGFNRLYADLELPWSGRVERHIKKLTQTGNPVEARGDKVQDFRRDSAAIFDLRRASLTLQQRTTLFERVADIAAPYYDRESFGID